MRGEQSFAIAQTILSCESESSILRQIKFGIKA